MSPKKITKSQKLEIPEFDYVARKECGCVVGLCADFTDKDTAKHVYDWIKDGCHIERVHRSQIGKILEHGFGCDCEEKQEPQLPLFSIENSARESK